MQAVRDPSHRRGPRGPYTTKPPKSTAETYILICLDGKPVDKAVGIDQQYCLATSRIFTTREQALAYSAQIHPMRKPLIVAGDWISFRLPV